MPLSNYTELQAAAADFLNRDDLTAVVPTFITLAEAQISRDLRHWKQERRVTGAIDSQYEQLPTDFLEAKNVYRSDGTQLKYYSTTDMALAKRRMPGSSGPPQYYCFTAGQFEVWPPPGEDTLTLLYYARIPALSEEDPSNWLLEELPDIYLYGTLLHTAPYLKDDERVQIWTALYSAAVSQANTSSRIAMTSGGPLVQRVK
jgi:hypothetical protein